MALLAGSNGQRREVRVPYFDHPFWRRTREEFYQRRYAALERARKWVLLMQRRPPGGFHVRARLRATWWPPAWSPETAPVAGRDEMTGSSVRALRGAHSDVVAGASSANRRRSGTPRRSATFRPDPWWRADRTCRSAA